MQKRAKPVPRTPAPTQPLSTKQKRELEAIRALSDDQIDTSDIPQLSPGAWKNAVRGRFYRRMK